MTQSKIEDLASDDALTALAERGARMLRAALPPQITTEHAPDLTPPLTQKGCEFGATSANLDMTPEDFDARILAPAIHMLSAHIANDALGAAAVWAHHVAALSDIPEDVATNRLALMGNPVIPAGMTLRTTDLTTAHVGATAYGKACVAGLAVCVQRVHDQLTLDILYRVEGGDQ